MFTGADEARGLATPADDNPTLGRWRALAARYGTVIVGGFCELGGDGALYNSAAVVDASGTLAVYRKAHLWDAEKLVFTPGDAPPPVVDLPFGAVAVMICYDLEFPEWVRLAVLGGGSLIAAPVNWPAAAARRESGRPTWCGCRRTRRSTGCSLPSLTGAGTNVASPGSGGPSSSALTAIRWPARSAGDGRLCSPRNVTWPGPRTSGPARTTTCWPTAAPAVRAGRRVTSP